MHSSTFTVTQYGNYFLVKYVYKVKHTDYISWEDSKRGVVSRELLRLLKNKDVLSETKCPYAHQLGVVNGPLAHWVVHSKESCALTPQGVCASQHQRELICLPAQLKG